MTDQELAKLVETEQRSKSNSHRLDEIEDEIKGIKNDQKAIYSIATSVEVIAQRITTIEAKVDDTNAKVDSQAKALKETEAKLSEKINESERAPLKQTASNINQVKVAIISSICTLLASGIIGAAIAYLT